MLPNPLRVVPTVTVDYSAVFRDFVPCDPSGGAFAVFLPTATQGDEGLAVVVKNVTADATPITVTPPAGTLIDGLASVVLADAYAEVGLMFSSRGGVGSWSILTRIPAPSGGAPVASVFARTGAVVAEASDYDASQVDNDSSVAGATVADALDNLEGAIPPAAPVDSVFGRTGVVAAAASDYDASQVDNDSSVAGATVADALDNLEGAIPGPSAVFVFGAENVTSTTADRFLPPGFDFGLAPTAEIALRAPFAGTLSGFGVVQNNPGGNGEDLVYTVLVNGAKPASGPAVTLASTGSVASDGANTAAVAAGDLIGLICEKALSIGGGAGDLECVASVLLS